MLALIVAGLMASTSSSPQMLSLAQASAATDEPAPRKVCHNEKIANSRFTRRVCDVVKAKRTAAPVDVAPEPAPAPVAKMTDFGVGMNVVDGQGARVGVVTAVAADAVTIKTDKHEAQLAKSSLTISDGQALFGMTQAELDASVEKAAAAKTELAVGVSVKGVDGVAVGTVDAIAGDNVTIKLTGGQKISIPRSGISVAADGSGMIGLTAAQLDAQLKAARPAR